METSAEVDGQKRTLTGMTHPRTPDVALGYPVIHRFVALVAPGESGKMVARLFLPPKMNNAGAWL